MSIEIQGLDRLMNKLNKLDNIKAKVAVNSVAKEVEGAIKEGASWSDKENCIKICDERDYGKSYFVDVGLKGSLVNWEDGKILWFHNWGYFQFYYGHPTGKFTNMHMMWFNNSVSSIEGPTIEKLKNELRKQIKTCLEG